MSSAPELLDDVEAFLARFVIYPGEAERVAHVLWIAHTWFMDAFDSTPRLAFLSPEPGSGKSRALEVTEPLVPRPIHAVNVSANYLFRKVSDEAGPPTILYDEIDTVFGPKAKENEEIRGLLNAGHRKGAFAGRAVVRGTTVGTEELPAYCAVALAGLDDLPDTIMTRSVVVRMRRRAPGEKVEPWRMRINGPEAELLQIRLAEWSNANQQTITARWPEMPDGIEDRNADVWEALLAVADLAGDDWPERARVSAVTVVTDSIETKTSLGIMLLRDIRSAFKCKSVDKISTVKLLESLNSMDESPWGDIRGKQLDARSLSRRLNKYEIAPSAIRDGGEVFKGYRIEDLRDAWNRYLPAPEESAVTSVTPLQTDSSTHTDKAVISAMVGQQIRQIAATDTLEAVAIDRLARALIDSADEIIEVWRKPFNVAAADLMAAFEKIGDKPLDDSAAILRLGGDIADVWTKARAANQLIDKIALGWAVLGELSRRASLVSQYRVLRIADVPPRRALREFRNVKLTPWEAVTKGLPLSLATLDEFRERESATVGSADAVRQESEQDARDAAQRRYGFATA